MYDALLPGGALVTYCAKGVVKRTMKSVGFEVEALPGPPRKERDARMEEMIKFNARCYVLIRSKQNRILVMQERWQGVDLNKFPGGGLELGEGSLSVSTEKSLKSFLRAKS